MASVELGWRLGGYGLRGACGGKWFASLIPTHPGSRIRIRNTVSNVAKLLKGTCRSSNSSCSAVYRHLSKITKDDIGLYRNLENEKKVLLRIIKTLDPDWIQIQIGISLKCWIRIQIRIE